MNCFQRGYVIYFEQKDRFIPGRVRVKKIIITAVLATVGALIWYGITRHNENTAQRRIVHELKELVEKCRAAGTDVRIFGKVLVWDMRVDSRHSVQGKLPASLRAKSADKKITVFMILGERVQQVGTYSVSGEPAYRTYTDIAVAVWPDKRAIGFFSAISQEPPSTRPVKRTPEYGSTREPIATWIKNLPVMDKSWEKKIYFLDGHGERDIQATDEQGLSEARKSLESMLFNVHKLLLSPLDDMPDDTGILILPGPRQSLRENELKLLENILWLKGGRLLLMIDPFQGGEIKPLLKKVGIILEDDVVVTVRDPWNALMGGGGSTLTISDYGSHLITRNLSVCMLSMARGVAKYSPLPPGMSIHILASTGGLSWGEMNFHSEIKNQRLIRDDADREGPIDVAAACEFRCQGGHKTRLVVCGDSDFASNRFFGLGDNHALFDNMILWLSEE
jgi:hypothetical protein